MAKRALPNIGLIGNYSLGEDGWGDDQNANLLKVSVLLQGGVKARVAAVPTSPAPAQGDVYVLTAAPNANAVAAFDGTAWVYFAPIEGWWFYDRDANTYITFDGAAWAPFAGGGGGSGGIPEAPMDGQPYARKDGAWVIVSAGGGGGGGNGLVKIAQTTLTADAPEAVFTGLDQGGQDLVIIISGKNAAGDSDVLAQFNGDTGNNYNNAYFNQYGASQQIGTNGVTVGTGTTTSTSGYAEVLGYAKPYLRPVLMNNQYNTAGTSFPNTGGGAWRNTTDAINAVRVFLKQGGNMAAGTTITIYARGGSAGGGVGATAKKAWLSAWGNLDSPYATANAVPGFAQDINSAMQNYLGSWFFNNGGRGDYIVSFDFHAPVTIDGVMFMQTGTENHGQFQMEGSNDNAAWTALGAPGTWGGTQRTSFVFENTGAYRYYRLRQVSGAVSSGPYQQQFQFRWAL